MALAWTGSKVSRVNGSQSWRTSFLIPISMTRRDNDPAPKGLGGLWEALEPKGPALEEKHKALLQHCLSSERPFACRVNRAKR